VLRVVGEPYEIAAIAFEEPSVGSVKLRRQGASEPGDGLVSIDPVQVGALTIEEEALARSELGTSDPETDPHDVRRTAVGFESTLGPVEVRIVR
jgi:hypothetical protein